MSEQIVHVVQQGFIHVLRQGGANVCLKLCLHSAPSCVRVVPFASVPHFTSIFASCGVCVCVCVSAEHVRMTLTQSLC